MDPALVSDAGQQKKRKRPKPDAYLKDVGDRKLKGKLRHTERLLSDASKATAKIGEWLAPAEAGALEAEGAEETWRFKQEDIAAAVAVGARRKAFDLPLPDLGPYCGAYSRSGRHLVLGGRRGHLAVMEWERSRLVCEVQVAETTRAVTFLHNELFFAAAQKKYAYIYDKRGLEVHCLREHTAPAALEFLPHHFLLASVGDAGVLHYQDTSHGAIVAQHRTRLGPCGVMRQNPHNGVLCLGHANGTVTMWTPNITSPVVKMLTHRGAVTAVAVDPTGHQLVTAGVDCQVKVWDIRTFKPMHAYFANAPATALDISQRGMLAVGQGRRLQVWQDALASKAASPYLTSQLPTGGVESLRFCPFEDVLGAGAAGGFSSLLVPGAGEPNVDSFLANPYASLKERREAEVVALLDKLQPDTIVLDPDSVGRVLREPTEVARERKAAAAAANAARVKEVRDAGDERKRMKGKNKPSRRQRRKQNNVIEDKKPAVLARMREEEEARRKEAAEDKAKRAEAVPRALRRFAK
ncbi:MAG: WD40-repeat-containing domain protein [Monoraphidium minutum]|nr:MAG: WD40-repeat-containing domain protein [Monoraphidium minutum]